MTNKVRERIDQLNQLFTSGTHKLNELSVALGELAKVHSIQFSTSVFGEQVVEAKNTVRNKMREVQEVVNQIIGD